MITTTYKDYGNICLKLRLSGGKETSLFEQKHKWVSK